MMPESARRVLPENQAQPVTTYNRTVDTVSFLLWGGWHVTLFHPWVWFANGVVIVFLLAVCAKGILAR